MLVGIDLDYCELVPSRVFSISVIVLLFSIYLFCISSMSMVIVLTALMVSCIFSILFSSLQIIFTIIILNSLSGRSVISSLFIWSCEFVVSLCYISLSFHFFPLTYSSWGLLFPGFRVVVLHHFDFCHWRERLVKWFLLGVTSTCVLVGGDHAGCYRNNGTYIHTSMI